MNEYTGLYLTEEFTINKDRLRTTLPLLNKEYGLSFELSVVKYGKGWQNILHLTTGGNWGQIGDRIPAVFLLDNRTLHILRHQWS